jgi:hypothetical protein
LLLNTNNDIDFASTKNSLGVFNVSTSERCDRDAAPRLNFSAAAGIVQQLELVGDVDGDSYEDLLVMTSQPGEHTIGIRTI